MRPPPLDQSSDMPDLTPMIDIVFLLIVFFMTVANMQVQERVPIEVPIAENSTIPEERLTRVTVTLTNDGSVFYGPQLITMDDLGGFIERDKAGVSRLKVSVRADARVPFKFVRDVFAAAAEAGVPDVIFAAYQSDK